MSQESEQHQTEQFEQLLELSFRREKRKQMKLHLQQEEHSIQRLVQSKSDKQLKFQRKRQFTVFDVFKFTAASEILASIHQSRRQKMNNSLIYILLIIIALGIYWVFFLK